MSAAPAPTFPLAEFADILAANEEFAAHFVDRELGGRAARGGPLLRRA